MAASQPATPAIDVNGKALSEEVYSEFFDLRVDNSSGAAAFAQLRFFDVEVAGSTFKVGDELKVGVVTEEGAPSPVFTGVVVSLGIEVAEGQAQLTVGAYDESFLLGQNTVVESHMNASAQDVIKKMAAAAGVQAEIDASTGTKVYEFIQQSGTPHQFMTQLAEAHGCEWFVENGKLTVKKRKKGTVVKINGSEELRRFSVRYSAVASVESVEVRGWDPTSKKALVGTATSDGKSLVSTAPVFTANRTKLKTRAALSYSTPLRDAADADDRAEAIAHQMEAASLTGRGEVDVDPKIKPGAVVEIEEVATEWNGTYYVTGAEHVFGRGQPFATRFTLGAVERSSLVDMFGNTPSTSTQRLTDSITIGVVTNVQDDEGSCRVKVKLPYVGDDNESGWARVVQQGAGPKRGWTMLPEVDDEVVVAFENGDIQRPLIIGGLWNGKDKPPVAKMGDNGKIESRSFTSRTGHTLTFSDVDGDPDKMSVDITLADKKAHLFIGEKKIELHANDEQPIEVKTGKSQINLTKTDVTIKADNITLEATQKLALSAKSGLEAISDGPAKLESKAKLDVKGALVGVEASGIATVKGSMVQVN